MALQDLAGKRSGRPRGAKTSSRVWRDMKWVYKNLHKPDAEPPTPGARAWLELARTNLGQFLECLLKVDARERRAKMRKPHEIARVSEAQRRIRTLFVPRENLGAYLTGDRAPWVSNLPRGFQILAAKVEPGRDGVVLTIVSGAFSEAPVGQPIPEWQSVFANR